MHTICIAFINQGSANRSCFNTDVLLKDMVVSLFFPLNDVCLCM